MVSNGANFGIQLGALRVTLAGPSFDPPIALSAGAEGTFSNPRMPLVRELVELLEAAWRGR